MCLRFEVLIVLTFLYLHCCLVVFAVCNCVRLFVYAIRMSGPKSLQ